VWPAGKNPAQLTINVGGRPTIGLAVTVALGRKLTSQCLNPVGSKQGTRKNPYVKSVALRQGTKNSYLSII
jgi:hypothetical protein